MNLFNSGRRISAIEIDSNGLIYTGSDGHRNINIHNPETKRRVGIISANRIAGMAIGPDNLIYTSDYYDNWIHIYNPKTRRKVGSLYAESPAFDIDLAMMVFCI